MQREKGTRIPKANLATGLPPVYLAAVRQRLQWKLDRWPLRLLLGDERPERQDAAYQTQARIIPPDRWTLCARLAARRGELVRRTVQRHQPGRTRWRLLAARSSRPG